MAGYAGAGTGGSGARLLLLHLLACPTPLQGGGGAGPAEPPSPDSVLPAAALGVSGGAEQAGVWSGNEETISRCTSQGQLTREPSTVRPHATPHHPRQPRRPLSTTRGRVGTTGSGGQEAEPGPCGRRSSRCATPAAAT